MIVVHETADDATIWEEINYEKNTYEDAFVHAFVDGNNIIVISNTDHEAWGLDIQQMDEPFNLNKLRLPEQVTLRRKFQMRHTLQPI